MRALARVVLLSIAIHAGVAGATPAVPMLDDPAREPYVMSLGPRDAAQRGDELVRLSGAAERAGKHARAARYLAMACYARSMITLDAELRAAECEQARALAEAHDLVDVHVFLDSARGNLQAWRLDVPGAVATLRAAIARGASLDVESDLGAPVRYARFALAAIMLEAGRYDEALLELDSLRTASVASADPMMAAWCDLWMCRIHARLGEIATARAKCAAARRFVDATQDWLVSVNLEWIDGGVEALAERHDAALARYRAAWTLAAGLGAAGLQSALMVEIPGELLALGRIDEAAEWSAGADAALSQMPPWYAPQVALLRGMVARARGEHERASDAFVIATGSPMHGVAIHARYELAAVRRTLGDLPGARTALEGAIARVEDDRAAVGPDQRASFMTLHATAYRELVGVTWDLEGAGAATRALELAEAGRARALLDAIVMSASHEPVAQLRSADQIRAALPADVALIEYVVTSERAFAIVATRDALALVPLPGAGGEVDLARRISFFQQLVAEARDESALALPARRLYADLLAPALAALPAGTGVITLMISPDGPLHGLPWDALHDGAGFVVERWRVAVVPSASVVAPRERTTPSAAALVVAVPEATGGLPPLPASLLERDVIRRQIGGEVNELVGAASTEDAITREIGRHAVVHIAGHATIDRVMPLRSSLLVAAGGGGDGRLRADEIYRLAIGADLVVLAACETGIGATTSGEGVMSLSRAFLHAGAHATIATLWPVDDAIGPAFAEALYSRLAAGQSIVRAAADARRELRARGARPADWAAYVVTGSPSDTVRISSRAGTSGTRGRAGIPWLIAGGVGGLSFMVLAFALGRRKLAAGLAVAATIGGGVLAATYIVRAPERPAHLASNRGGEPRASMSIIDGRATWARVADADYRVTYLDADGRALTAPAGPAPSIPSGASWVMVETERDGAPLSAPMLAAVPR